MMYKVIFTLFTFSQFAFATSKSITVWDDLAGFTSKNSCNIATESAIPMAVVDSFTDQPVKLSDNKGNSNFHLARHSIVEVSSKESPLEDHSQVVVLGVSSNYGEKMTISSAEQYWGSQKASSLGTQAFYINDEEIQPLSDYYFEVLKGDVSKKAKINNVSSVKTFWRPQANEDYTTVATCCTGNSCESYIMFQVYSLEDNNYVYVGEVGLSPTQTEILKDIRVIRVLKINSEKEDETATEDSAETIQPEPIDLIGSIITDRSRVIDGPVETLVCLNDVNDTLNVRDMSLENVLFDVSNGATVKVFQGWENQQPRQKTIRGTEYNFVRVQADEGAGYVPQEFLKHASTCDSVEEERPAAQVNADGSAAETVIANGNAYFVCTESGRPLNVRDLNMNRLSSNVKHKESVMVVEEAIVKNSGGIPFVKVKTEDGDTRYIGSNFLNSQECSNPRASDYVYPVYSPAGYSYLKANRRPRSYSPLKRWGSYQNAVGRYGAYRARGGGVSHPATDLYQKLGQSGRPSYLTHSYYGGDFRAMTDGVVIRGPKGFTEKTYYIQVLNDDGTMSVYGEIDHRLKVSVGDRITAGQRLGHVKWTGYSAYPPMLHFENYRATNERLRQGIGWKDGNKRLEGRSTGRANELFSQEDLLKNLEAALY